MKSFFRFLLFISLSFALVINVFAIDAPINIEIENSNDTSVVVTWEPVADALMYYVYYWTESWKISDYENYSDFVEWNSVEINDLNIWTNYYFVVTSLDENWEESTYSDEIVYDVNNLNFTPEASEEVASEWDVEISNEESTEFIFDWVFVLSYNKLKSTNNIKHTINKIIAKLNHP